MICGSKQVLNCIKCFQDLITNCFFSPRNIVGLDNTVLLCYFQVAVELVLLSLVCFLLCVLFCTCKVSLDGLLLAYPKVDCRFPGQPLLFNLESHL